MKTFSIELSDEHADLLAELAQQHGMDVNAFVLHLVKGRAERAAFVREWAKNPPPPLDPESAAEERQLAEMGMEGYAAGLAREDRR